MKEKRKRRKSSHESWETQKWKVEMTEKAGSHLTKGTHEYRKISDLVPTTIVKQRRKRTIKNIESL